MKTSMLSILTIALLISGSQAKAADPQPTSDTWYVYVDEDTQYASQHVAKRTLASGNIEYRIDSRVLYDLLGNRQEETTDATYVVTPDFAPVSARVHTTRAFASRHLATTGRSLQSSRRGCWKCGCTFLTMIECCCTVSLFRSRLRSTQQPS